jgi:hypothetical protein
MTKLYEVTVRVELTEAFLVYADDEEDAKYKACCRASGAFNDVHNTHAESVMELPPPQRVPGFAYPDDYL